MPSRALGEGMSNECLHCHTWVGHGADMRAAMLLARNWRAGRRACEQLTPLMIECARPCHMLHVVR